MANGDALIRVGSTGKVAAPAYSPRANVTGLALAAAMGSVTLLTGGGVAPAGQAATVSMGTVAVTASSVVNPTGQSATTGQGTISFTGLGADLHIRVGSAAAMTAPSFTSGTAHTPTGQALTASQGTATAVVINGATPTGQQMVADASGAGVDIDAEVGVDGIAMTASQGTANAAGVGGNNAVFPTGQSVTVSQGTVTFPADATVYPIANGTTGPGAITMSSFWALNAPYWWDGGPVWGYSVTPAVVVTNTQSPSGQSITVSQGTPLIEVGSSQTDATVPVGGMELATAQGTAAVLNSHDPAGFGLTASQGTALIVVDDAVAPSGIEMTAGQGIATVQAGTAVAPTGMEITTAQGTATTSGNRTVSVTGFRLVTSQGTVAMGGTDLTRPLLVSDRSHPAYHVTSRSGPRYVVSALSHPRYWILEVRMADELYFNNDDEFEFYVSRRNTSTGAVEPAAGIAGMTCRVSATETGSAIHANLSVSATERASAPGYYYGVFQGSDIATQLAALGGKTVYRQLVNGTDIVASKAVTVRAKRRIV